MKKVLMAVITTTLLVACNNPNTASTSGNTKMNDNEQKQERNKQTALASVRAFETGNADMVLKDIDNDAVEYGEGSMKPVKGADSIRAGMKKWLPSFKTAFPDYKMSNVVAVADSNYVMVYGEYTGTFKNDFMGKKATGKSFKINDVDIFKFNDAGKITEHRSIQSNYEFARQTGMKM